MTTHRNNFAGQSLDDAVTTTNSADSGDAFTLVSPGSGAITYAADPASGGRVALKLAPSGATSCYVRDDSFNNAQISLSDCFYYGAVPSGLAVIHKVTVGSKSCASVGVTENGLVRILGTAGSTLATDATALTVGHWYRFETQVTSHASAGSVPVQWYIDDGATPTGTLTASGVNTRGGSITIVDRGPSDSASSGYQTSWQYSNLQARDGTVTPLGAYPASTGLGLHVWWNGAWVPVTAAS